MSKNKKVLSIILIAAMLVSFFPLGVSSAETIYNNVPGGQDIIKNATFTDIKGNSNADNIMKMSAYSIIRSYGSTTYSPNTNISRDQLLAALVRAIGEQQKAVVQANTLKAADPTLSSVDAYLRGHIEVAKTDLIITAAEITALSQLTPAEIAAIKKEVDIEKKNNWKMTLAQYNASIKLKQDQKSFIKAYKTPATREEAAVWIGRALKTTPISGEKTMAVYDFTDWGTIKMENLPVLEALLRKGIIKGATSTAFKPTSPISRSEAAGIINAVSLESMEKLGFTTGYGRVTDSVASKSIGFSKNVLTSEITIETPTLDTVKIRIEKKTEKNADGKEVLQTLAVIKNGAIGNETMVAIGDIAEYTLNTDGQVVLLYIGGLRQIDGKLISYDPNTSVMQIEDAKNVKHDYKVNSDTVIQAQKTIVEADKLLPGADVKIIYQGSTLKSVEADIVPERIANTEINAKIMYVDPMTNMVKFSDENNNIQRLKLSDTAKIYMNGEQTGVESVGFDQDAIIKVFNGQIVEANIYTDMPNEDETKNQLKYARVRSVSGTDVVISMEDKPEVQETYTTDGNTVVMENDGVVKLSNLRQGDKIKLTTDNTNSKYISRIEVQASGAMISGIFKGDIKQITDGSGDIILTNVYKYGYYDWIKKGDYEKFKLNGAAKIYKAGAKLTSAQLKDSLGKTVYIATADNFGADEIMQLVTKDGFEDTLSKRITGIKWTASQVTLSDGRTVNYQPGTIIVRDGYLLDNQDLSADEAAFIIQNKASSGISSAALISLESFNGFSNYVITRGYLHNMGDDYFTIENGYKLLNNIWTYHGDYTFQLNNEAYIYDNIVQKAVITADRFAESRYKPYTYSWPNYSTSGSGYEYHKDDQYHTDYTKYGTSTKYHEHDLLYTISDSDGNTQAISIYKKDKNSFNTNTIYTEKMTAGQLNTLDAANKIFTLKNAREYIGYSTVNEGWRAVTTNLTVDAGKAVILRSGKQIALSDITTEDNIYVLSDSGFAIFVLVD